MLDHLLEKIFSETTPFLKVYFFPKKCVAGATTRWTKWAKWTERNDVYFLPRNI